MCGSASGGSQQLGDTGASDRPAHTHTHTFSPIYKNPNPLFCSFCSYNPFFYHYHSVPVFFSSFRSFSSLLLFLLHSPFCYTSPSCSSYPLPPLPLPLSRNRVRSCSMRKCWTGIGSKAATKKKKQGPKSVCERVRRQSCDACSSLQQTCVK